MGSGMYEAKRRALIFGMLAFAVFALVAVLLVQRVNQVQAAVGDMVEVVVAAKDVPARTALSEDLVTTVKMPKRYALPSLLSSPADVKGQLTTVRLAKGEPLTAGVLRPVRTEDSPLRTVTLMAGTTVVIPPSTAPGDRVDVIAARKEGEKEVARVVLEGVPVVDVYRTDKIQGVTVALPLEEARLLVEAVNFSKQVHLLTRTAID